MDRLPRILLAEDDADTREMYSHYLSYCGLDVTAATTGRRALESVRRERPDVVVTDIAMPEMDGLELSRRLRADRTTRDILIIAVSGQVSATAWEAGADMVLEKPCGPDALMEAISDLLNRPHHDDGGHEPGGPG